MNPKKIQIDKFSTRDVSDTPENFEKRYEARKPKVKRPGPLEEPTRSNMSALLSRFGLDGEKHS